MFRCTGRENPSAPKAVSISEWSEQQLAALRLVAAHRERQEHLWHIRREMIGTWLHSMRKASRAKRHASVRKRLAVWEECVGYDRSWHEK